VDGILDRFGERQGTICLYFAATIGDADLGKHSGVTRGYELSLAGFNS
jgi:hypothetical protein